MNRKKLAIMGTRGVPARHGGFETFAECLALYLVRQGWDVTVYCQEHGEGPAYADEWRGVKRVTFPVKQGGALGTIIFDWRSIRHLLGTDQTLALTLGYNTALFCLPYRLKGVTNIINMDGIEWKRDKWRFYERVWLWLNERAGCWFGNHLVADHPEIANHLATRVARSKITTIPYGAPEVAEADAGILFSRSLEPGRFVTVIARPEPENSILEIVRAFSRKRRGYKLAVLGTYHPGENSYHKAVMDAASDEVIFTGAIYDKPVVEALRVHARLYVHGHTVGGTNPSLVEALGAGSAVLAHDNLFNRWVAGPHAAYFHDEESCCEKFDELLLDDSKIVAMKKASHERFDAEFRWEKILSAYERLLVESS